MRNKYGIKFVEKDHTYWLNGNRVPNVTTILGNVGLVDDEWFTEESCERGNYIHAASIFVDDDDLDWKIVPDDYFNYLLAYKKFLKEVKPEWEASEEIVFNATYNYVGTLDRRGPVFGRKAIVDLKSGGKLPWHRLQVAAYAACFDEPHDRYSLYLRRNGSYKLEQYKDRNDIKIFRGSLALSNWKGL